MAADVLRDAHWKEVSTQAALVSGICISAAAFVAHEALGRPPGLSLWLSASAIVAFGLGFAAGTVGSHAKQAAIAANIGALEARTMQRPDLVETANSIFDRKTQRAGTAYIAQLWCILLGAAGFLASQTAYVYRSQTADELAAGRRCLAVQRDMLSAHPRRDDSRDLFQALGCRPQGEGSVYAPRNLKGSQIGGR